LHGIYSLIEVDFEAQKFHRGAGFLVAGMVRKRSLVRQGPELVVVEQPV
jgi:hypothetical protein